VFFPPHWGFWENNLNRKAKQVISLVNLTCFAHQIKLFCPSKQLVLLSWGKADLIVHAFADKLAFYG